MFWWNDLKYKCYYHYMNKSQKKIIRDGFCCHIIVNGFLNKSCKKGIWPYIYAKFPPRAQPKKLHILSFTEKVEFRGIKCTTALFYTFLVYTDTVSLSGFWLIDVLANWLVAVNTGHCCVTDIQSECLWHKRNSS